MKKKIGITGINGFVGTHLRNFINLQARGNFELVPFDRSFFTDSMLLNDFVSKCDVIVHLAGVNRHLDSEVMLATNVALASALIEALESTSSLPHLIFSSSTQESKNNPYGQSKKIAHEMFESWSQSSGGQFTCLLIPNVFGPFGDPYYNSVVATFCHQLALGEEPVIQIDASLPLIYVGNLVKVIFEVIIGGRDQNILSVGCDAEYRVTEILRILRSFQASYLKENIIPELNDSFQLALFNTFRCYIKHDHFPVPLDRKDDERGHLFEVIQTLSGGQVFYSSTKPGITRGNHYHTRKIERFCVVHGDALIRVRQIGTDDAKDYYVSGDDPVVVDMPIFHTHNITNIGEDKLLTLFWSNEIFDPNDPDTFSEIV